MATTKTRTQPTESTSKAPAKAAEEKQAVVPEEKTDVIAEEKWAVVAKDINPNQYVVVRNGFQGKLIYQSRHTGEIFIWDTFGAEQEMELRELRNAKNSSKSFFINNWFMFDEEWIVDYLGVRQFYKNSVRVEDFDKIFSKPPEELKKLLKTMPEGQRHSVAYRAHELIASGEIDSRRTIAAIEEALGIELIER